MNLTQRRKGAETQRGNSTGSVSDVSFAKWMLAKVQVAHAPRTVLTSSTRIFIGSAAVVTLKSDNRSLPRPCESDQTCRLLVQSVQLTVTFGPIVPLSSAGKGIQGMALRGNEPVAFNLLFVGRSVPQ